MTLRSPFGFTGASIVAAFVVTSAQGCSGSDINTAVPPTCGPGTEQEGGVCVPSATAGDATVFDAAAFCAPGTLFVGGVCVAADAGSSPTDAGGGVTCGAGTVLVGSACVPAEVAEAGATCGAGTTLVNGACVPTGSLDASTYCGPGTVEFDGVCVPSGTDASTSCGPGTVNDGGVCVPVAPDAATYCAPGTLDNGGVCVPIPPDAATYCAPGTVEKGGACVPVPPDAATYCAEGTHVCAGQCYADDDPTACGTSCTACDPTVPTCAAGTCTCTPTSCGAGFTCDSSGVCVEGTCSTLTNCSNGLCCNGTCIPGAACCVASDCAAPNDCQSSVTCDSNGQCDYANAKDGASCSNGGTCCTGSCDQLPSDKFNCGGCGNLCYGGAATASCVTGHCAELVAEASNTGGAPDANRVYAPSLAVDGNNVYFLAPGAGELLQSPLATLGNTQPQVLVTQNGTGSLHAISQLLIDPASVYYASYGAPSVAKIAIGGGGITPWGISSSITPTNPAYMTFDTASIYVGFGDAIGYASRNGGTLTSLLQLGGSTLAAGIASDGENLYFPLSSTTSANYTIESYDVGAQTRATLATAEAQPQAFAIGYGSAYWSEAASPFAIRTVPLDLSAGPSTFEPALTTAASTIAVDPDTGNVYWVEGGSGTGNGQAGPLKRAPQGGGTPVVITPASVWGSPAFDGNGNVYYMITTSNGQLVQVWRSPE